MNTGLKFVTWLGTVITDPDNIFQDSNNYIEGSCPTERWVFVDVLVFIVYNNIVCTIEIITTTVPPLQQTVFKYVFVVITSVIKY